MPFDALSGFAFMSANETRARMGRAMHAIPLRQPTVSSLGVVWRGYNILKTVMIYRGGYVMDASGDICNRSSAAQSEPSSCPKIHANFLRAAASALALSTNDMYT